MVSFLYKSISTITVQYMKTTFETIKIKVKLGEYRGVEGVTEGLHFVEMSLVAKKC